MFRYDIEDVISALAKGIIMDEEIQKEMLDVINNYEKEYSKPNDDKSKVVKENYHLKSKVDSLEKQIENTLNFKAVNFNDKKQIVTIVDNEGKVFQAKPSGTDEYDPYIGFALAFAYKMFGSKTSFRKTVDNLIGKKDEKNNKQ